MTDPNLQSEMEAVAALGYEITVECSPVKPDERMASKGFAHVTRMYNVWIGKPNEEPIIKEGSFDEPFSPLKKALERLRKEPQ